MSVQLRRLSIALLIGFLAIACAMARTAAHITPVFDFTIADFLRADSHDPPADDAAWQPALLPDNWRRTHPDTSVGWYRVRFELPPGPYFVHTLYLPRGNLGEAIFMLNRNVVSRGHMQGDARALNWDEPVRVGVAPSLLRPGLNTLYVRVEAVVGLHQGLSRITLGPSNLVLPRYFRRYALQVDLLRLFGGAALLAGGLAVAFWLRNRRDSVMLWFGITAWTWTFMSLPWFQQRYGDWGILGDLVVFPLHFAYIVPLLVLCLRFMGGAFLWLEVVLWSFTAIGALAMPLVDAPLRGVIITEWSAAYLLALVAALGWLFWPLARHQPAAPPILIVAVGVAALLGAHDFARWMGWISFDSIPLQHFDVPLVLLAAGTVIVRRHFTAVDAAARTTAELEDRVAQKAVEIETNHQRLRQAEHEATLARERSRIMADMHDGVGASLLSLLGAIRADATDQPHLERRVHEAMLELRLSVDSLEPVDRDLGVVLGILRHRLREAIEESGASLCWQIGDLPPLDYLSPKAVQAIQRILLEAMTNALRHARAHTITVSTEVDRTAGHLLIRIVDDGIGFDADDVRRGRGLDSMQNRARGIGAIVSIAASAVGTTVCLALPLVAELP